MKISDPFREAGWWFRVAERHFELCCGCGVTQRVDELRTRAGTGITLYECEHCGATVVGVATDDRPSGRAAAADADGHRMCGFVFGSAVDMTLSAPGATEGQLEIPARPGFFTKRGC
jgi:hypothetical protein